MSAGTPPRLPDQLFQFVVEAAPHAMVVVDRAGLIFWINGRAEQLFGYAMAELLGQSVELLVPEGFRPGHAQHVAEYFQHPSPRMLGAGRDLFARRKDGTQVPVEIGLSYFAVPPYALALASVVDITLRKQIEAALQESELRFRQVAENTQEVLFLTTPDSSAMLYVNPAYERMWGRSCASLYANPRSFTDVIHPEDRARVLDAMSRMPAAVFDEEYRILHADGSVRWISARTFPIADETGRVSRVAGIAEDITESRRAAEALQESERRYADLIDNAPDPIVTLDHLGFVRSINRATEQVSGYRADELVGRHFTRANVLEPSSLARAAQEFAFVFAGMDRPTSEYTLVMKDGGRRIFEANQRPLRAGAKLTGVQVILRDVTDRKDAEMELRRAYETLRTAQDQLLQSEKLAALGQMGARIAHDLKNPLGIAALAVNLLKDPRPLAPEAAQEALAAIDESIGRADRIVRELLVLSRPAAVNLKPVQPNDVITTALELAGKQRLLAGVTVEPALIAEPVFVMMDVRQMQEVFLNLFENARHAMADGGRLTVKTFLAPASGVTNNVGRRATDTFRKDEQVLVCEVADTGTGIPAEQVEKIFEPFYSTKPAGQGTGLGLAIVRSIVEAHRGVIAVDSAPGSGTTFRIILPVAPSA